MNAMFVGPVFNTNSFVEKSMKYLKLSVEKLHFKNNLEIECQDVNDRVLDKTYSKTNDLFPKS